MTNVTALVDQSDYVALLAALGDARADAAQWRSRYMAAHDVLLHVEAYIEMRESPSRGRIADWDQHRTTCDDRYRQMRAAFLAYRAAVEAGAPLGWAVAEEPAEVG